MKTFSKKYAHQVAEIFQQMDQAYKKAADAYDFVCNGCEDNCCNTHFFHHTHIEFAYLVEGLTQLPVHQQNQIIEKAHQVCEKTQERLDSDQRVWLLCPLNKNGKCMRYDYRPMICRLHGLAHELKFPGKPVQYTPGCNAFSQHFNTLNLNEYYTLDRTPHYMRMARLEQQFMSEYGISQRFKKTIAEMLILPWQDNDSIFTTCFQAHSPLKATDHCE
jgi:Fe-S-cluster containining protein